MKEIIEIKRFDKEDLECHFKMFLTLFAENTRGHEPEKIISDLYIETKANEIFKYFNERKVIFLGALCDKKLIGFLWAYKHVFIEEERIYINSFIIDEQYRGKKIGEKLLIELEHIAELDNIQVLDVSTATFKKEAIKFYERKGFEPERVQLRKPLR